MTVKALHAIPPTRRDRLFARIRKLVNETEAVDRSLEPIGEGVACDEVLEEIVGMLRTETRRSRRRMHTRRVA